MHKFKRVIKLRSSNIFIFLIFIFIIIFLFNFDASKVFENTNNTSNSVIIIHSESLSEFEQQFKEKIVREKNNISCDSVFEGNKKEVYKCYFIEKTPSLNDKNYIFTNQMCSSFRKIRGYDDHPVSEEEINFPIAYSILTYFNTEQFERLLRVIYRSHNIYCIHIDLKSSREFHDSINSIANCFDNVFITSKLENVVYSGFSRLQADLNCMSDLLDSKYKKLNPKKKAVNWKYLFNLASTEFPLKTNHEIVKILKLFNGANDIEVIKDINPLIYKYKWILKNDSLFKTDIQKEDPPHGFILTKGLAYGVFSYEFIDYAINNKNSIDLLKFLQDTYSPDELFWASLQYNMQFGAPGGYKDNWKKSKRVNSTARWIIWSEDIFECFGSIFHSICRFSCQDLQYLISRREFFANKFLIEESPTVYQCMEEWINDKEKSKPYIRVNDYCSNPVFKKYNKEYFCDFHNYFAGITVS